MIRVFSGATKTRLLSFGPYPPAFTGGVAVAAADSTATGAPRSSPRAGAGGGAQVKVFDGTTGALVSTFLGATGSSRGRGRCG